MWALVRSLEVRLNTLGIVSMVNITLSVELEHSSLSLRISNNKNFDLGEPIRELSKRLLSRADPELDKNFDGIQTGFHV